MGEHAQAEQDAWNKCVASTTVEPAEADTGTPREEKETEQIGLGWAHGVGARIAQAGEKFIRERSPLNPYRFGMF